MPKISVIVPVYNTDKYLHKCVDSILSQTFTSFELLLINDGSKDCSGEICDEYARKDVRIRVFHKENGGVSSARNLGIENARGEWIAFVDSDDFLPADALRNLLESNNEDLIIGGYKNHFGDELITLDGEKQIIKKVDFEMFLSLNINSVLFRTPWCKLFKKEIIDRESLRFDNSLVFGEDTVFVTTYLLQCKSIRNCDKYCYNYYNIGDDYISKYKEHSDSILHYCDEITSIYKKLDLLYSLSGVKIVYGFIFDILKQNYNIGEISTCVFAKFLLNPYAIAVLEKRNSIHIRLLLFLAKYSKVGLYLYNNLIKRIKNVNA